MAAQQQTEKRAHKSRKGSTVAKPAAALPATNSMERTVVAPPVVKHPDLREVGGSRVREFNNVVANQAFNTVWRKFSDEETLDKQTTATLGALVGIAPGDEIEGMMAAQMVGLHNAAMECLRRGMLADQSLEGREVNLNQANKLTRSYAALVEALNRHRGKGQQKVTVEHVHVHEGGQAIVGSVHAGARGQGGGGETPPSGEPHA